MKCSTKVPPCYLKAHEMWGVTMDSGVVFTYGDTCHCKDGFIPDWLEAHEIVHSRQQTNPEEWWNRYFEDVNFRLSQELEAYQEQYKWIKRHVKDRNSCARWLNKFASDLSSPMYGGIITYSEALKAIHG